MSTLEEVRTDTAKSPERSMSRLREWFEPGDFFRFLDLRPFDDRMRIEEETLEDKVVIRAEVPGVDPDKDVKITVDDGVLSIHVERRQEETRKTDGSCRSEFHYGSFQRSLMLPRGSDASDVTATYRDGILQVEVPLPAGKSEPATIEVKRD